MTFLKVPGRFSTSWNSESLRKLQPYTIMGTLPSMYSTRVLNLSSPLAGRRVRTRRVRLYAIRRRDTGERARRPRRRIWGTGHWRGHPRARGPTPPTFVVHGVEIHGPDSDSNFARCVLHIRPSHWRPRTPRKVLLSHVSSTAGTAKFRAVALDRRRPALARAVDPPKQARLPCYVL